ncbi:MAG: hydantoinase B/oxoprolinase family protein [Myxococcota bacterium]
MAGAARGGGWQLWVDRGGTFTDCIGVAPDGAVHVSKLLSSDAAPIEGLRALLARAGADVGDALRGATVRLGTTVATNALLERRGASTAVVATRGLGDVFEIGTQERPALFDLSVARPPRLHCATVEIGARIGARGEPVAPFDADEARTALAAARAAGATSVAVALLHATVDPAHERACAALAREAGFAHVVASHEIANEQGLLARGETAIADAYLTPLLRRHVDALAAALPAARVRFMQSSGGLTEAARFRGPNALLSGPAGGVVAAAAVARRAGFATAVGFDMGGTSTDVSLVVDGEVERAFETQVGGVRVKAPMLRIHTVAAGGGSLCGFDGFALTVGPGSAGALPGPLCYGRRDAAGAQLATRIAVTDANALLGRIQPDRFPFALDLDAVRAAFEREARALGGARALGSARGDVGGGGAARARGPVELAAGFLEVANAHMAQAIAEVSIARGVDVREAALVAFGGAAGQHACAVARRLGVRTVLLHPLAGVLSAFGIGCAPASWDGERDAGRIALPAAERGAAVGLPPAIAGALAALEREGRAALVDAGEDGDALRATRSLDLRYAGTDTALAVSAPEARGDDARAWRDAFERAHRERFGYAREGRDVEIAAVRVRVVGPEGDAFAAARPPAARAGAAPAGADAAAGEVDALLRRERVWFEGAGFVDTPVLARERLASGVELAGPALVIEDAGTIVVEPGFRGRVEADGVLRLDDAMPARRAPARDDEARETAAFDPVRIEVFGNRFMSIAEQMGAVLRNTAVSTNIKERLDYSCAVFDADGGLVANAPHIPVHLGAMSETVRCAIARFGDALAPGDVVLGNDPFEGGSHLPDVTAVTPVFAAGADAGGARPLFFVASRGHHADIGGRTPGSMPPDSRTLEEEGVVLEAFRVVRAGRFDEDGLRERLARARFPARRPDDNVADTEAMIAANEAGARGLRAFADERGAALVARTMGELQEVAAAKVAREIARLPDGLHRFADALDDGTPVAVALDVRGDRMRIDFAGTGPASPGNLNAPRAVVQAAVLYVLRSLVAERFPLNGGCLRPVEIAIPAGSLLDPPRGSAVVGGNVETSQRIVDVLLGALGAAAASQGTMNNVTFGDERFGYYETLGGGAGAGPSWDGASGVHTHMTNTRITDAEVLESRAPVRLETFALRRGSGGAGRHRGGDGLVRRYRFTAPVAASVLTERRTRAPWGLAGGEPGARGSNRVVRADGSARELASRAHVALDAGDALEIATPGGGGYGAPEA